MDLYDFTRPQLAELIASWGCSPLHAARLWGYLYREGATHADQMHALPPRLRAHLLERTRLTSLGEACAEHSSDRLTHKYLLELAGGQRIETVLMRYPGRVTACLSSQAGCALGCFFCATGQIGFSRNLTTGEIVAQALHVDRVLRQTAAEARPAERHVRRESPPPDRPARSPRHNRTRRELLGNIVLMGMGEPLLNYDAVLRAVDILRDPSGLAIGAKQITLSTVGVVPGIIRLADEAQSCSLAVSLHAATQEERAAIIPAARAWPLDALIEACRYYTDKLGRRIFFEWTLIEDCNDSAEQAHALARLLRGMSAQVNLIPLNATAGYAGAPARTEAVERFQSILRDQGLPSSVRQRRGIDIAAGCGQLAAGQTA
jgi:23S rRNA (adenine2503-C2)-methyltransferase